MRKLGEGTFSQVWEVQITDHDTNARYALKVVSEPVARPGESAELLKHELELARAVGHPGIAKSYSVYCDVKFAALRLEMALDHLHPIMNGEEIAELRQELRLALEGLDALHRLQVIHRDVKPNNLLRFPGGVIKLSDFGLSCRIRDQITSRPLVSVPTGTIAYMSPQQLNLEPPSPLDDIYSVGATLYELLATRPPFYTGHLARQIETRRPDSINGRRAQLGLPKLRVPRDFEDTIMACLEKDPADRPQKVGEVIGKVCDSTTDGSAPEAGSHRCAWWRPKWVSSAKALLRASPSRLFHRPEWEGGPEAPHQDSPREAPPHLKSWNPSPGMLYGKD